MEIIFVCLCAFFTSIITFFSGFGLGTILAPVFALFFPIDIAIALTGIVHFFNNIFKIVLVGKATNKKVLLQFGIPAIISSFIGAWLLIKIAVLPSIFQYQIWGKEFEISIVKITIAILLIAFSLFKIIPSAQKKQFGKNKLVLGGILSGFFGGLAGIQGAIRSAFLIKSGLSKESYIATGVLIACLIDFARLSVYALHFSASNLNQNIPLVILATLSAITGAVLGKKLLKKVTLQNIQFLVGIMLIIISVALAIGIL